MGPVLPIILAAAAACAVTTSLAAVLLLAERYLVQYGQCELDVNNGDRKLEIQGGKSVLETLKGEGIFIPSACGGRGSCAYCKLKITEGGGPIAPTETSLLTDEEMADDVRITCQVKVRNDMKLLVPEDLLSVREYKGVVESITDMTHDIKQLRIRLTEPAAIEFKPGQYIQLEAPAYGSNPEPVYRAYSVSSPPDDTSHVELIIRLVPGGICTTWVFTRLKEGDEVKLNGPYGDFYLTDTDREMIWIAGGSGMAPFWSMVRHMDAHQELARKTTYFFGAVRGRDLFLLDELRALADKNDWFHFVPALSGASPEDEWNGETGLITEVVDRHVNSDEVEVYLCGSPGMVDAAGKVVSDKGIAPERMFYDKFA